MKKSGSAEKDKLIPNSRNLGFSSLPGKRVAYSKNHGKAGSQKEDLPTTRQVSGRGPA